MKNVVVYGVNCLKAEKTVDWLREQGKTVVAFCDGDSTLWGKEFYGVMCCSPKELPIQNADIVIAAYGKYTPQIVKMLNERGINWFTIGQLVLSKEESKFREVFATLSDDLSRQTLSTLLTSRCSLSFKEHGTIRRPIREQYFGYWGQEYQNMVAVDCGAYTGENIEDYLFHFKNAAKIYAFEPNPQTYRALKSRCQRLSTEWMLGDDCITCVQAGVGESDGRAVFGDGCDRATSYALSRMGQAGQEVNIVSLDNFLRGGRIDFLKSDIEGAEMLMLRGAAETIRKWKPKMAISIYHSIWDMYEIPLYLKSLVPEYHLDVRHYTEVDNETVLYAHVSR
jgi:FkbM family methyltransferase